MNAHRRYNYTDFGGALSTKYAHPSAAPLTPLPCSFFSRMKHDGREIGLVGTVERQGGTKTALARTTFSSTTRAHVFLFSFTQPRSRVSTEEGAVINARVLF